MLYGNRRPPQVHLHGGEDFRQVGIGPDLDAPVEGDLEDLLGDGPPAAGDDLRRGGCFGGCFGPGPLVALLTALQGDRDLARGVTRRPGRAGFAVVVRGVAVGQGSGTP